MPPYYPTAPENMETNRSLSTQGERDLREVDDHESLDWYEERVLSSMTPSHITVEGVAAGPMLAARLSTIKHPTTLSRSKTEIHTPAPKTAQRPKSSMACGTASKTSGASATSDISHRSVAGPYTPRRLDRPTAIAQRASDGPVKESKIDKTSRSKGESLTIRRKKVVGKAVEEEFAELMASHSIGALQPLPNLGNLPIRNEPKSSKGKKG